MTTIFPRTRKQRLEEQLGPANFISKHRKTMIVSQGVRGDVTKRRELFSTELNLTKTPHWLKRRKNRAANKVARKSRRVNRMRAR